ncbi:MAG: hypothetical protein A2498_01850 [Lentisphaerae bacterium RIFOXYC12_FULL_60_16]|nr:MAG: hypothetical protein A2498_01850 [Lentisphaerae bacterium RIFOXYC12_FULL_60_16]
MLLGRDFDPFFAQVVGILEPYLQEVLCIGGCANALYRFHALASPMPWAYLGTKDIDFATPLRFPMKGGKPVATLMKEARLVEDLQGSGTDAVIKYKPLDPDLAADLEFLCPLSGAKGQRGNSNLAACEVQEGLHAQPLRYLDILFCRPWTVSIGKIAEFRKPGGFRVRVPNPAAYVVQKVLIRDQRRSDPSKAKDCYYLYEISVVFRDALDHLAAEFAQLAPFLPSWKKRFQHEARHLFQSRHAEGPTLAMQVYRDAGSPHSVGGRPLTPEMIYRSVNRLLENW